MATSFLLKPNINLNPLVTQLSSIKPLSKFSVFPRLMKNPRLTLKCSVTSKKPVLELSKSEIMRNPFELVANALLKAVKPFRKVAVSAVFFMVLSLVYFSKSALAASGGRMGGSSFSSGSSSSSGGYSSSSSSYSSGGSSYSSSGDSYSFPTSSPSCSSTLYTSGDDGKTTWVLPKKTPKTWVESVSVDAGRPHSSITHQTNDFSNVVFSIILVMSCLIGTSCVLCNLPRPTSVVKLQVGLLGSAWSLQKDLNRIAKAADTSKKEGLTYILTETTLAILRHPDYCISGYSSGVKSNMQSCEKQFNQLSIEERGKVDEETLVNSNNIRKQSTRSKKSTGLNNEYIVVTILVAAEGVHKLPTITSSEDLKEALKMLGSITTSKTLAVEVLWTPQEENDTLTEREMLENYPHLRLYSCLDNFPPSFFISVDTQ